MLGLVPVGTITVRLAVPVDPEVSVTFCLSSDASKGDGAVES